MKIIHKRDRSSKKMLGNVSGDNKLTDTSPLEEGLGNNLAAFQQFIGQSHDINIRKIKLHIGSGIDSALLFVEGLADKDAINDGVIKALKFPALLADKQGEIKQDNLITAITEMIITHAKVEQYETWTDILDRLLSGDAVLLVDGFKCAIVIGTRKWVDRGVEQPTNEQVIRGPRDSFTETLTTNIMLIRRRIKSHRGCCKTS